MPTPPQSSSHAERPCPPNFFPSSNVPYCSIAKQPSSDLICFGSMMGRVWLNDANASRLLKRNSFIDPKREGKKPIYVNKLGLEADDLADDAPKMHHVEEAFVEMLMNVMEAMELWWK
uniref:Uncharacterized protein n=1 Tax=Cucumis melo TaxID=3656 RepID=A0A9I9E7U4_CUCME